MIKIQKEFSQNAKAYNEVNIIQKRIAKRLLSKITDMPKTILDIGCGNGTVYKQIDWPLYRFVGMDFAEGMLSLHPKASRVTLLKRDFNDPVSFQNLPYLPYDRIVSASALQWSKDLDATLGALKNLDAPVSLAIFTSDTFKTLYETAGLPPLLRSREEVISLLEKYFDGEIEIAHYTLTFNSVREMFRYMKRSGVGAGRNVLGYKEMRRLMCTYPLEHLEYEIVLLHEQNRRAL